MARIRTIKPGFWTDEKIVQLSPFARLLFIGLWNFSDDEGRRKWSPVEIKMQIFPADSLNIEELLAELLRFSLILRYTVDGIDYIQIAKFSHHQRVDKRWPSKIPPPILADSPQLSTIPHSGMEGNGKEIKTPIPPSSPILADSRRTRPAAKAPPQNGGGDGFDEFWTQYPKRVSKGQAKRAWKTLAPSKQTQALIIAALGRAKTSAEWRKDGGRFIPHPATWLRAEGWLDEHGAAQPDPFDEFVGGANDTR